MGEIQSTSLYLRCQRKTVARAPCLGQGPVKRLFPVNTGNQLDSDSVEPY